MRDRTHETKLNETKRKSRETGVQVAHVSDLSSVAYARPSFSSSSIVTWGHTVRSEPMKERIVGFITRPDEIYAHLIKFQTSCALKS